MRKKRPSANNAVWFISQPGTIWNISLLFQSISRRRPWYGNGSGSGSGGSSGRSGPNVAASDAAEMDDLQQSASTAIGRDDHGPGDTGDEYWYIDDPI